MHFVPDNIWVELGVIVHCVVVLGKAADLLVDGAIGIANLLRVPKMVIGIVLVSVMTTMPEFAVSMISAVTGRPTIAFGNAIGAVIANALALGLGIVVAPFAIRIDSRILRNSGLFLVGVDILIFVLSVNGTVSRGDGIVLLAVLVVYLSFVFLTERSHRGGSHPVAVFAGEQPRESVTALIARFLLGVMGVLVASDFLVGCAERIAIFCGVPVVVVGLTLVALGTSIPEIATCISAARKGHGDLAFGDIIGADVLNVLWIVGASASVNPLAVGKEVTWFSLPSMIVIVSVMLLLSRWRFRLEKWKGVVLIAMYGAYIAVASLIFGV